jgi:hypothetical protein
LVLWLWLGLGLMVWLWLGLWLVLWLWLGLWLVLWLWLGLHRPIFFWRGVWRRRLLSQQRCREGGAILQCPHLKHVMVGLFSMAIVTPTICE